MLNVPFAKLMRGAEEQVFAYEAWLGMDQRHHILQLVAKTDGASRLIEATARPSIRYFRFTKVRGDLAELMVSARDCRTHEKEDEIAHSAS